MATNNAVNLKSSGIASYDGAGTFSALANPLTVPNGGTSASSFTAYAVLCSGTTSTSAIQNVSGVGTAGQALTSNGASNLPTWQTAPSTSGFTYNITCFNAGSALANSTTYFLSSGSATVTFTANSACSCLIIPRAGVINRVYGASYVIGTKSSANNSTLAIRVNNGSDTTVTSTLAFTAASNTFSNTSVGLNVSAGDYISLIFTTPVFTTAPTDVGFSATIEID